MRKNKKIYKRLFIGIIAIYVVFTLANQQKTLNQYTKNISELSGQITRTKRIQRRVSKKTRRCFFFRIYRTNS